MAKVKILVNAISTKKHAGGAFQISQNYLLKSLECNDVEWYYIISKDLDEVVGERFQHIKDKRYFVFPTQPDFKGSYFKVKRQVKELEDKINPNVVYSVTAPSYFSFKSLEVMRFTNPWVTHPNKYAWSVLSWKEKIHYYLYAMNQKRLMKSVSYFITQTETCAKGIRKVTGLSNSQVKVVNNVLPAIFKSLDNSSITDDQFINIACVGAATPHKNFDLIPDVLKELKSLGFNNIRFHLTLPTDEPTLGIVINKAKQYGLSEMIVNHGRISQKELGEMYRRCHFCFLPTLLEVFSASIIEAMYYDLPIVATDFAFNSEVLMDSCLYYKPKNAKDAAAQFAKLIHDKELQKELISKMRKQLSLYASYDVHFESILDFLLRVASREV